MKLMVHVRGFATRKDGFFVLVLVGFLVLIVAIQQLLPNNQPLPFARVDGNLTRISSKEDVIATLRITEERELTLKINDYTATYKVRDLGIKLEEQQTIEPYIVESRLRRLIPFSVLAHMYRDNKPVYTSSKTSLLIVTSAIADQINVDPKNAEIATSNSLPTIVPSQDGVLFEPEKAMITIFDAIATNQPEVLLASKVTEADITTSELEVALEPFVGKLPDTLTIVLGTQTQSIDKPTLLSWLDYEAKDSAPVIGFNKEELSQYAANLTETFASGQQPTATLVNLLDGKETGRLDGKSGKTIQPEELSLAISDAVANNQPTITARLVDVPSPIRYARSYTRSSAGLKEMLDQITTGKEISVKFVDINSRAWDVGSRADSRSYMASTYKMFVAYSVLKRVDAGTMSMTDAVNGKTVDACLQTIIIDSDNDCAIALAERIGWITIQNEGKALGATALDWTKELSGTVSDASVIPIKLARGEILSDSSRNYLLDLMKRQRFRSGIPAGTSYVVANKVGFFDGWLNDAGIVYAGEVPYVLAIYTKGQTWGTIAEITRQIESLVR
jgi:beta-lactamase class A